MEFVFGAFVLRLKGIKLFWWFQPRTNPSNCMFGHLFIAGLTPLFHRTKRAVWTCGENVGKRRSEFWKLCSKPKTVVSHLHFTKSKSAVPEPPVLFRGIALLWQHNRQTERGGDFQGERRGRSPCCGLFIPTLVPLKYHHWTTVELLCSNTSVVIFRTDTL